MNKKMVKVVSTILMAIMIISIAASTFAADTVSLQPNGIGVTDPGGNDIQNVGSRIIGILQTVGVVLSVVVLIVLGIKYMMGSAEEKAEYKKTMIPYLVGAALIFAASAFAQVIYGFFTGFTG